MILNWPIFKSHRYYEKLGGLGVIHIWRPLWGGIGCVRQKWDVIGCVCWTTNLYFLFFVKENGICAITRHHAEPNINILLTKNLPFHCGVRQWSHPLKIPLHCLWTKSNNRMRVQFEYDVTWFCFCFYFSLFTCTVQLLFDSLFTFSSCASKTDWLENEYQKSE